MAGDYTLKQLLAQTIPLVFGDRFDVFSNNHNDVAIRQVWASPSERVAKLSSNSVPSDRTAHVFSGNRHTESGSSRLVFDVESQQSTSTSRSCPIIEHPIEIGFREQSTGCREIQVWQEAVQTERR